MHFKDAQLFVARQLAHRASKIKRLLARHDISGQLLSYPSGFSTGSVIVKQFQLG